MARTVQDAALDSRTARARLAVRKKPYWRTIHQGAHLGYYRGQRGGSWSARLFADGRYHETKLGTADDVGDADGVSVLSFRQAQGKAHAWFAEKARANAGIEPEPSGPYTVADAVGDYLAWHQQRRKAHDRTRAIVDAHILPPLGSVDVARLTTRQIRSWHEKLATQPARLRSRKGAPAKHRPIRKDSEGLRQRQATANRILTVLKAALNHAWREGRAATDAAWRPVRPFRDVDAAVVRYLTEAECTRLVNVCTEDFRKLVQAALLTGCRYGELTALRVTDFNPDAGTLTIRASKSGKPRHVVLTSEGQRFFSAATAGKPGDALILTRSNGEPWGRSHQHRPLKEACAVAKISPAVSFHILRHTHGSTLAMKGVPLPVIAKQLGHADTRMTEKHYAHLAPNYVADTIRANFPDLGIVQSSNVVVRSR